MIGRVMFAWRGGTLNATLGDDMTWTTMPDTEPVRRMLNVLFGAPVDTSPADGRPGYLQLKAVAKLFDGKAFVGDPGPQPEGRIY